MKSLTTIFLFISGFANAQNNSIAHFSFWKPKAGQEQNYENGYKKHLNWHKTNGDKWSWYGWYFITGQRDGQFVDATFNHNWSDFDKSVNPAEDEADNTLHTYPFGDFLYGFNVKYLANLSISDSNSLKSKFMRLITLNVSDIEAGKAIVEKLKSQYLSNAGINTLLVYKIVDGGNINQLLLFIGISRFEDFGKTEDLQENISVIEKSLNLNTINSFTSETLVYRADMSLIPN